MGKNYDPPADRDESLYNRATMNVIGAGMDPGPLDDGARVEDLPDDDAAFFDAVDAEYARLVALRDA